MLIEAVDSSSPAVRGGAPAGASHPAGGEQSIAPATLADASGRHGYQPPRSARILGSVGTVVVFSLVAAGALLTLDRLDRPRPSPKPITTLLLPATPAPAPAEKPREEKPKPVQKQPPQVQRPVREPLPPPIVSLPVPQVAVAAPQRPVIDVAPPLPAAPTIPQPAPPAQPAASHGPDKWEGRVLARLERFRRYPADAQRARVQGIVYLHFRVGRDGHVLSSSVENSSGYPALDDAAMETLRRADPLPRIPPDRPSEVELLVPVEFFIGR